MENTTKTTATGIVAKIMAFLKLGEEGKIISFFERLRKNLKRQIEVNKRNKENLVFNNQAKVDKLNDDLEDAKATLEQTYLNVPVESVSTNADQEAFESTYWSKIEKAESEISRIKKQLEDNEISFKKQIESIDKTIAELQYRLGQIA